ncbi:MAG: hypothetical protein ABJA16_01305, partial [Nakamurella sp.]
PENILGSAFVTQVSGDDRGRFFRPADSFGRAVEPPSESAPGRVLEAYHWGRFTSGSWTQALWLLIIPFGVLNAASFTLPRATAPGWGRVGSVIAGAALRAVGLVMTCILVFAAAEASVDLWAWQRQAAGDGGGRQWWSVVGAVVPVGLVVLFYFFGRTTTEGQDPAQDVHNDPADLPDRAAGSDVGGSASRIRRPVDLGSALADPDFFDGDPDAPALRRLHCAAPLHLVAGLLVWPGAAAGEPAAGVGRWAAGGLFAVNALIVVFLGDPSRTGGHRWWHTVAGALSRLIFGLGIVLILLSMLVVGAHGAPTARESAGVPYGGMPGIGPVAMGLLYAMVGALAVLLLATAVLAAATPTLPEAGVTGRPWSAAAAGPAGQQRLRRAFGRFAFGMTAWLLGSIAGFLAVGFAAAATFAAESILTVGAGVRTVRTTPLMQRVAYAWGLTVVIIAVIGVVIVVAYLSRRGRFEAAAGAAFAADAVPPVGLPAVWVARIGRAMFLARLKNAVPLLFTVFAVVGLVLSLAAGIAHQFGPGAGSAWSRGVDRWLGWLTGLSDSPLGGLVWLGTWSLTALAAALVVLGRGALRAEKARRGLNVIWDVVAFWPRRAHPFVPPPYSLHVVAALRRRISWHLGTLDDLTAGPPERPADRVVVAAHSQGSLISVAALLWLSDDEAQRVGLVTFGSQLQQQFVRAFPAAVDLTLLGWLWDRLGGRWRNLYRDTDPIAGPVLSWHHQAVTDPWAHDAAYFGDGPGERVDPVTGRHEYGPEWRLLDPVRHDIGLMAGPMFQIRGHGDYPADPSWADAVAAVLPPG